MLRAPDRAKDFQWFQDLLIPLQISLGSPDLLTTFFFGRCEGQNMVALNTIEMRSEERDVRFSGAFSGFLVGSDESRQIPIRPLDVSKRGLGFVAREHLKMGGVFWLHLGGSRFRVELAYCHSHLGIEGLYRCGLFLREAEGDLAQLCARAGLLVDRSKRMPVAT